MSLFNSSDNFNQTREKLAEKHVLSVDRNNLFIALFMATETQSQGIKHSHKRA